MQDLNTGLDLIVNSAAAVPTLVPNISVSLGLAFGYSQGGQGDQVYSLYIFLS